MPPNATVPSLKQRLFQNPLNSTLDLKRVQSEGYSNDDMGMYYGGTFCIVKLNDNFEPCYVAGTDDGQFRVDVLNRTSSRTTRISVDYESLYVFTLRTGFYTRTSRDTGALTPFLLNSYQRNSYKKSFTTQGLKMYNIRPEQGRMVLNEVHDVLPQLIYLLNFMYQPPVTEKSVTPFRGLAVIQGLAYIPHRILSVGVVRNDNLYGLDTPFKCLTERVAQELPQEDV